MKGYNGYIGVVFSFALMLCAAGAAAEHITFGAASMTGTAGSASDMTVLTGDSHVTTPSMQLAADSITMSGEDFRYIDAAGNVVGKNTESAMDFSCDAVHYDRHTRLSTLKGNVSLTDNDNGVDVTGEIVEYDGEADIATIQINAVIKQKDNVCSGAFAIYHKKEQKLELNGNAQIQQGNDVFHAQVITLDLNTQEITLDGHVKGSVYDSGGQ